MTTFPDLAGERFNVFVVLGLAGRDSRGYPLWHVRCDCGRTHLSPSSAIDPRYLRAIRCPCLAPRRRRHRFSHGMSSTPEYAEWRAILRRSKTRAFIEQGLEIEPTWRHDFTRFLANVGVCPLADGRLARTDLTRGYVRGNVRWVARKDAERRANAHMITIDGITASLSEWAQAAGLRPQTLRRRLELGWRIDKAFRQLPSPSPNSALVATGFVTDPALAASGAIPCHPNAN